MNELLDAIFNESEFIIHDDGLPLIADFDSMSIDELIKGSLLDADKE